MECEFFMKFSIKLKFQAAKIYRIRSNPAYPAYPVKTGCPKRSIK